MGDQVMPKKDLGDRSDPGVRHTYLYALCKIGRRVIEALLYEKLRET